MINFPNTSTADDQTIAWFQKHVDLEHLCGRFVELKTEKGEQIWQIGSLYVPCRSSYRPIRKDMKILKKLGEEYKCVFGGERHIHNNTSNQEIDCLISKINRIIKDAEEISIPLVYNHNNKYVNIPPILSDLFKLRQKLNN